MSKKLFEKITIDDANNAFSVLETLKDYFCAEDMEQEEMTVDFSQEYLEKYFLCEDLSYDKVTQEQIDVTFGILEILRDFYTESTEKGIVINSCHILLQDFGDFIKK